MSLCVQRIRDNEDKWTRKAEFEIGRIPGSIRSMRDYIFFPSPAFKVLEKKEEKNNFENCFKAEGLWGEGREWGGGGGGRGSILSAPALTHVVKLEQSTRVLNPLSF